MQNPLRDKLESAALRLDHFLDAVPGRELGRLEGTLLAAAIEIAQAIDILNAGE
jgi:hypothetical protein